MQHLARRGHVFGFPVGKTCPRLRTGTAIDAAYVARAYRRARIEAAKETGLEKNEFPEECPYTWNHFVAREFTR